MNESDQGPLRCRGEAFRGGDQQGVGGGGCVKLRRRAGSQGKGPDVGRGALEGQCGWRVCEGPTV